MTIERTILINKLRNSGFNRIMSMYIVKLFELSNISDKKINTLFKFNEARKVAGFVYRYITSCAYRYGVPKVYIDKCLLSKRIYDRYSHEKSYLTNERISKERFKLKSSYMTLIVATIQMAEIKNSRKEKLLKLQEKIAEQKFNI